MTRSRLNHIARALVLLALTSSGGVATAAKCRSEAAATVGGANGYNSDTKAAEANEKQNKSVSDILGQCVNGITGVVSNTSFISLDQVLEQIKRSVCQVASDKVHQAASDVAGEIDQALKSVTPNTGPISLPPPVVSVGSSANGSSSVIVQDGKSSSSTSLSDFWKQLWK